MATKIDLCSQLFEDKVVEKPPVPSRPSSGKFHNRGKLFPSTCHHQLFQTEVHNGPPTDTTAENSCREIVLHHSAVKDDADIGAGKPKRIPNYCKRTQSAKARQRTKPPVPASRRSRPHSAGDLEKLKRIRNTNYTTGSDKVEKDESKQVAVIDLADNITPDLFNIQREKLLALPDTRNYSNNAADYQPMSFSRPSSAVPVSYGHEHGKKCGCKTNILSKEIEERLKPAVMGLQRQRHVYGSTPDLTCDNLDFFPYKTSKSGDNNNANFKIEESQNDRLRNLPLTLEPLHPWLTDNVPQELIGVDPAKCLIFLPNMDFSNLPEVPEPHTTEDDLPYFKDVTTSKPWNPKKYPHPFNKQPVEEWICKHNSHTASEEENMRWTTVYKNFKLPRMRTADVIKKEISDLENLLKGVGTQQSDCAMVRYQDDLSTLQDMLQVTMDKIPERLKAPAPETPDRFGLNKVFKDHDSIIEEIQSRVEECRLELAELELEAGIDTERQYFRKRSNSTL